MFSRDVRRRWMLLAAAVAATVALAACLPGRSEDPGPGPEAADLPPTPDPCLLLTPDEIAAVQGGPTEAGMETFGQAPGHRACLFGQQDSPEATTISVFPGDDLGWQDTIDDVELNFEVEEIAGLGDAAFIGANVLHVHKGQFIITLYAGGPWTDSERKAKVLELAPKALARL